MRYGRPIVFNKEKEFWDQCYRLGMQNPWCSGKVAEEDGDFVVEEDRLNRNSVSVIERLNVLKAFFKHGNWCLGNAVIYRNLCFIQQDNGGDEWLTIKKFSNGVVKNFESYTFGPSAGDYMGEHDYCYLSDDVERNKAKNKEREYFKGFFKKQIRELEAAKLVADKNGKTRVEYGEYAEIRDGDQIIGE